MNKPNLHPSMTLQTEHPAIVSTFPAFPAEEARENSRLIVLLPEDVDCNSARQRILELARAGNRHIQLLGLSTDSAEALGFRRRLVTMASLIQDGTTHVEATVSPGTNWVDAVRNVYQRGDVIVCFGEPRTGLLYRPLSQVLESSFRTTVYILSDLALPKPTSHPLAQITTWLGFLVIVLGFGFLQAQIVQLPGGWLQSILLILSILPEFWLIWVWNRRSI
jgi:hypothetical protein